MSEGSTARALVAYESMFGNTERVAHAVATGLRLEGFDATVVDVSKNPSVDLDAIDLLVVGAPTHAFSLSRASTRADAVKQGGRTESAATGMREWLAVAAVRRARPAGRGVRHPGHQGALPARLGLTPGGAPPGRARMHAAVRTDRVPRARRTRSAGVARDRPGHRLVPPGCHGGPEPHGGRGSLRPRIRRLPAAAFSTPVGAFVTGRRSHMRGLCGHVRTARAGGRLGPWRPSTCPPAASSSGSTRSAHGPRRRLGRRPGDARAAPPAAGPRHRDAPVCGQHVVGDRQAGPAGRLRRAARPTGHALLARATTRVGVPASRAGRPPDRPTASTRAGPGRRLASTPRSSSSGRAVAVTCSAWCSAR